MPIKTTHSTPLSISPKGKVTWNSKKRLYCKVGTSPQVFISDGTTAFTLAKLDDKHLPIDDQPIGRILKDLNEYEAKSQATLATRLPLKDRVNIQKSQGIQVLLALEICGYTTHVDLDIFQHFQPHGILRYYTDGALSPIVVFDMDELIAVFMPVQV